MELSQEPEVLKEQQAVYTEEVGETKAADLILEEESTEDIKTSPEELNAKLNEDEVQKDTEDANKQLASEEKEDQPGVSPSNDVGFKKVFKLVGFKFTVKKDKTEKAEPVQLLDVKPEVAEGSSDVVGDYKQLMTETVGEATQSEITASVDKTEEETQAEEMKGETSEKVTESPVEAESKEAEIKNNGIKSPDSPVSPSTAETASPLRKFFTQSWAGFRKRTSFRKPKEEVQSEKEKQEQEMEKEVTTEGIIVEEELEKEKLTPEKDGTEVSFQASDEKMESDEERKEETMVKVPSETDLKEAATPTEQPSAEEPAENINKEISFEASDEKMEGEKERKEETKMVEVPSETDLKEAATPSEQPSIEEPAEHINKDISFEASDEKIEREKERKEETKVVEVSSEANLKEATTPREQPPAEELAENIKEMDIILEGEIDLESKEKLEQVQKSLVGIEQSTVALHESKTELLNEVFEEKINYLDSLSPVAVEKPEEPFEIIEEKSEPKAPLATEIFDEKPREINIDVTAVVTEEEPQITKKEQLVLEQLVETKDDFQKEQPTVEQLKVTETVLEIAKEHFIPTDPSSLDTAAGKPPEGIVTSEVELLSSQEKNKMQGSPLKKLFTGPGLKKLSRKKRKGKKEAKPGEAAEEAQQLSDTAESPDDPRGESSASSPEEITESIEKASDAVQISEAEEGVPSDAEKKSVTPWASFKKMVTPKKRVRRLSEGDREEELDKTTESAPNDEQEDIKENETKLQKSSSEEKTKEDVIASEDIPSTEFPEESGGRCTREGAFLMGTSGSPPEMELPKSSSEEKAITSEGIPSTEFLEESEGRFTREGVLQMDTSGCPPEMELPKSSSEEETKEKVMTSEGIPSTEFSEPAERCTKEDALQTDTSGGPPEMELPKSSSEEETEEKVMTSEGISSTEFSEESAERCTKKDALQMGTSVSPSQIELPKSSSEEETKEKVMTSEGIPSTKFSESAERCTKEDALQTDTSGGPPEMELPKSSSEEETEEKVMTSEGISSTEFSEESAERCTKKDALQMGTSVSPPQIELPKSSSEEETKEKVMTSEGIPSTKFSESAERCTKEDALQTDTSGGPPEMELPKSSSEEETEEKVMTSEGISSTKFSEESAERCTKKDALQMGTSGSPPQIELPKYSSEEETEETVMLTSEGIPSTEFPEESAGRCTREDSLQTVLSFIQNSENFEVLFLLKTASYIWRDQYLEKETERMDSA
ncbi:A-kinase anchor protein 12 [Crotalus adamanteus]|uniref:A-kinase anchor protein 12 n=1 Tax=Crotalus adamanteus TaxID=8729 RepID=A0AAW1CBX4_CROAD